MRGRCVVGTVVWVVVSFVALVVGVGSAGAQQGPSIAVSVTPEASFPVGAKAANYRFGMGGRVAGLFGLSSLPWLAPALEVGYGFVPLDLGQRGESYAADTNLMLTRSAAAAKAVLPLGERFSLFARGYGGGYFAQLTGASTGSATGFAAGGGGGLTFLLSPRFMLELAGGYDSYMGLYDGISVSVNLTTRVSGPGNSLIPRADFAPAGAGPVEGYVRFVSVDVDRVFPVLYKYYDDHPIGTATIHNDGSRKIEDLEIRVSLKQFMDAPKVSARVDELAPGEEAEVDLYALFTEEILGVTEGAKVAAEVSASYTVGGRSGSDAEVVTLNTYDRNALRWDDDRKIAAFVTARDEEVQRFARNIASIVDDSGIQAIQRELQLAMAFFAAMDEHRCSYVVDPSSPYAELSKDQSVVDAVQFPRQTLQFRAGDCDDLSATYAALLEAVGVPTAFITVPGHIYIAFKLNMGVAEVGRAFSRPDDIIRTGDAVWVPVETTLLAEGFMAAWAEGARAWREHSSTGAAGFFSTAEAWRTYEPVAFGVSDFEVDIPHRDDVSYAFEIELDRFVNREIAEQERSLVARLERRPDDQRVLNRLGVLYARYGRMDEARVRFREANNYGAYIPALVNLGNIAYLEEDYAEARRSWERVLHEEPDNAAALLGVARVDFNAEHYDAAEEAHTRLARLAPDLADRYGYLGSGETVGGRAADVSQRHLGVVWED